MKILALFCLILMFTGVIQAQNVASDWEVTVYIPNEAAIVTLSAEGETGRIAVPELANESLKAAYSPLILLSVNHRWLVYEIGDEYSNGRGRVYVANLLTGICCTEFGVETELPDAMKPGYFQLVGISPDSTQLALRTFEPCIDMCSPTEIGLLVDLETMNMTVSGRFSLWNETPVGWVKEGIASSRRVSCLPGEMCTRQTVVSSQVIRDVNTGEIVSSKPIAIVDYDYDMGEHLSLTGEYISPFMYVRPEPGFEQLEYPVVVYYTPEMDYINWSADPSLIYIPRDFDFGRDIRLQFMYVRWAVDGQGVLIKTGNIQNQPTLLLRDGTTHPLDIPYHHQFLAGTPDGWLMYEWDESGDPTPESMSFFHYRYSDDELSVSEIVAFPNNPKRIDTPILLEATPLGASVTKPFPTVVLPMPVG